MALGTALSPFAWQTINDAPESADATWYSPAGIIAAAPSTQHLLYINPLITRVRIRLKHDDGATVATDPVVVAYGQYSDGTWLRLEDVNGDWQLTIATATTDIQDGTYFYTEPIEVLTKGTGTILVAVKTAYDSDIETGSTLEALPVLAFQIV